MANVTFLFLEVPFFPNQITYVFKLVLLYKLNGFINPNGPGFRWHASSIFLPHSTLAPNGKK
jgi:hypothetical protein